MRTMLLVMTALVACSEPTTPVKAKDPMAGLISRSAFLEKCRIDRQIEVCAIGVGRPDRTQESSGGTSYWYFERRTFDPITSKPDRMVQVVVEHSVVRAVNFN